MKTKALLIAGIFVLLATTLAYAGPLAKGDVPFEFRAGGKVLPAGQYEFSSDNEGAIVTVRSTKTSAMVTVLTRLGAGIHTTAGDSHIVFDKVGETYTLSEIWTPGVDGYMLNAEKGKHEHKMIDVPR